MLKQGPIMHRLPAGVLKINAIANLLKDFWTCYSPTSTLPILTKLHLDSQRVIQDHARKHPAPMSNTAHFDHHNTPDHIGRTELTEPDNWADDNFAMENDAFLARHAQSGHEVPPLSPPERLLDGRQDRVRQPDTNILGEYEEEPENNMIRLTGDDGIDCLPFGDSCPRSGNVYNTCAASESESLLLLSPTSSKLPEGFAAPCLEDREGSSSHIGICDDVGTSTMPGDFPSEIGPPTDTVHDGIPNDTTTVSCANGETGANTCEAVDENCTNPPDPVVSDHYGNSTTHNKALSPQDECQLQDPLLTELTPQEGDHGKALSGASSPKGRKRKSGSDLAFRPPKRSKLPLTSHTGTRIQSQESVVDPIVSIPSKIVGPDFIHSIFAQKIDDEHHRHIPYLKRLFFQSWGPYALRQIADACATMRDITTCESSQLYPSIPDLSRALDKMEDVTPILRRYSLVQLREARKRHESSYLEVKVVKRRAPRRSKAQASRGPPKSPGRTSARCDTNTLADMMSEQYPTIRPNDFAYRKRLKRLQNRLSIAVNWEMVQIQYRSALWMYPCGVENLPTSG